MTSLFFLSSLRKRCLLRRRSAALEPFQSALRRWRGLIATPVLASLCFPLDVQANPTDGQVVSGQAVISSSGSTLTVNQSSDRAIIHWQDFSIPYGSTTKFVQPSATSAALNRVMGGNPSQIYGNLQANGQVYLINPNGVLVGASGVINTAGFLASTLDVSDESFVSGGDLRFKGTSAKSVINMGKISASSGDVILIAQTVENYGEIIAPKGTAAMAAGSEVLVKASGEERVFVEGGSSSGTSSVTQAGLIKAASAEIKAAGGNEYALAIKHTGVTRATGVVKSGGRVYLSAGEGKIRNSGTIVARQRKGGGGKVRIEADHVELTSTSKIDVSAKKNAEVGNGGEVLIGGGYQGKDESIRNAQTVTAELGSVIISDAATSGDGGKVIVWSDGTTDFAGNISARGGSVSGDGGFAEVSGKEYLTMSGHADLRATNGVFGSLLLDPGSVTIQKGANTAPPGAMNVFNDAWISDQLDLGPLTIMTSASTVGGNETITVNGDVEIVWNAETTLTLEAGRNISVASGALIKNTYAGDNFHAIVLNADGVGTGNFSGIVVNNATLRTTGSGNISLKGSGDGTGANLYGIHILGGATVEALDSGSLTLIGNGSTRGSGTGVGVRIDGSGTKLLVKDGDLSITGVGGGSTGTFNFGTYLTANAEVASTGNGAIDLRGTAASNGPDKNYGVIISAGAKLYGTGGGISVNGTGGGTGTENYGVYLNGANSVVRSVNGHISIIGNGGGTAGSTSNHGISITVGGVVESTGTGANAAAITLQGTGGTSSTGDTNHGFYMNGANSAVRSVDGNIEIIGTGGGSGASKKNYGTFISAGAVVESTGIGANAATVSVTGNGGINNTGGSNYGLYLTGTNAVIRSVDGDITVNGTGGSSGSSNYGIVMTQGGRVESSGTGANAATITMNGIGGNGTSNNHGFFIRGDTSASRISSVDGAIVLTALAQGSSGDGMHFAGNFNIEMQASASLTLTAKGVGTLADLNANTAINPIGGPSATGDITINADTIDWGSALMTLQSSGSLLIQPRTASATIGLGTGAVGTLNLTNAELDGILDGFSSITIGHENGSGAIDVRSYTFKDDLIIRTPTGNGDVLLKGALATGNGSEAGSITLQAGRNIIGSSGASVVTQGKDIIINSDRDKGLPTDTGGGYISLDSVTLQSHGSDFVGGNIILGGGSNPETYSAENVVASGASGGSFGITITGSTRISSGTGKISMRGTAGAGTGNRGISANTPNAEIRSTSGNIFIYGEGGTNPGSQEMGVALKNKVISESGNIEIVGIARAGNASGILLWNAASLETGDGGTITMTGVGSGTGNGFFVWDDGTGSTVFIGSSSGAAANIIINSNNLNYGSNTTRFVSTGSITFQPITAGTDINIGGGTDALAVTTDRLKALQDGFSEIIIGHKNGTGLVTVGTYKDFKDNLRIRTPEGNGDIVITGAIATGSGTEIGSITLQAGRNIIGNSSASVTTQGQEITLNSDRDSTNGGNIQLTGTNIASNGGNIVFGGGDDPKSTAAIGIGTGSLAQKVGIYLSAGSVNAGTGTVTMHGKGISGTNSAYGIYSLNGNVIGSADHSGNITLDGVGGAGTDYNYGVFLTGDNTAVSTKTGEIKITGQGGIASGLSNYGVYVSAAAKVVSTDTGTVTLSGTGGNGTKTNHGVFITGSNTTVESSMGAILIEGQGGNGAGPNNNEKSHYGILITGGTQIRSTGTAPGAATITLDGTGGKGNGQNPPTSDYADNSGIMIQSAGTKISSAYGDILLTGKGGERINGNGPTTLRGIYMSGATIESTGTGADAASITLDGTGTATGGQDQGVWLSSNPSILSKDGDISITGRGNVGILLGSVNIKSTESGDIHLRGEGLGGGNDIGFYTTTPVSLLESNTGDITIESNTWFTQNNDTSPTIQSMGDGRLFILPRTANTTIGIGGGAGVLNLDVNSLAWFKDGFSEIVIGNTSAGMITSTAATFTDNLRLVTGADLAISGALDVGTNRLALIVGGNTTQTAALTAGSLRLGGNGAFNLTNGGNNIGTLAKDGTGSVSLQHATALTVGSVDGVDGVTGSVVDLRVSNGDLILDQKVTGTGSGNAVVLSTPSSFKNNVGSDAINADAGRWLVYSSNPEDDVFGSDAIGWLNSGEQALYGRSVGTDAPTSISESGNRYIFADGLPYLAVEAIWTDSKTYGDAYTFPALVEGIHYRVSGFVDASDYGDVFTQDSATNIGLSGAPVLSSEGASASKDVGGYNFSITQGSLTNTAGYGFGSFTSGGTLTVNKRPVTITVKPDQGKVYGDADPSSYTYTDSGLGTGGTALKGALERDAGEDVGSYAITQGDLTDAKNPNYTLSFNGDSFKITKKSLAVTANNFSKPYLQANPSFTASVSGFVRGDSLRDLDGSLQFATPATLSSGPGIYSITPFGLSSDNYKINFVDGALTVHSHSGTELLRRTEMADPDDFLLRKPDAASQEDNFKVEYDAPRSYPNVMTSLSSGEVGVNTNQ